MRNFKPRPWQGPMIDFVLGHERCALLGRMGLGKSSVALSVIDARMFAGTVKKTAVLAPLRVARSTWPEEAAKWHEFTHLRIKFLKWTPAEREFLSTLAKAEALEARADEHSKLAGRLMMQTANRLRPAARNARLAIIDALDVQTVNYELVPQLIEILGNHWPFDMVIADEATKVRNFRLRQGGKRAQALSKIAHGRTRFWLNLTGTFVPNGLKMGPDAGTFLLVTGHKPDVKELKLAQTFLTDQQSIYKDEKNAEERTWADFCQSLFASNSFLYLQ